MKKLLSILLSNLLCSSAAFASNCFSAADDASIAPTGWQVWQEGAGPTENNDPNSVLYPLTAISSQAIDKSNQSTQTNFLIADEIGANSCTPSCGTSTPTPQSVPHATCRLGYSNIANAQAEDEAETSYTMGLAQTISSGTYAGYGWGDLSGSLTIYGNCGTSASTCTIQGNSFPNFITAQSTICTETVDGYSVAPDVIVLPPGRVYDNPCTACQYGAFIVYEPEDNRACTGSDSTLGEFETLATIVDAANATNSTSYKIGILANRMDNNQSLHNGLCPYGTTGANTDSILSLSEVGNWFLGLDETQDTPTGYLDSLETQLGEFETDVPSKMGVRVALTQSRTDAAAVYSYMTSPTQYVGVWIWPNGETQGGSCSSNANQVTEAITGVTSP
jgi:hypothetical protein